MTGGERAVGKTNVSVNLGVAAAEMGQKVMLLDADLGLANIDVVLGLHPQYDLSRDARRVHARRSAGRGTVGPEGDPRCVRCAGAC